MEVNTSSINQDPAVLLIKYGETVENLAFTRRGYKNSIVKYNSKISQIELSKIKKTKYKELDPIFPSIIVGFRSNLELSNRTTKKLIDNAQHSKDMLTECKNVREEISNLKEIIQII